MTFKFHITLFNCNPVLIVIQIKVLLLAESNEPKSQAVYCRISVINALYQFFSFVEHFHITSKWKTSLNLTITIFEERTIFLIGRENGRFSGVFKQEKERETDIFSWIRMKNWMMSDKVPCSWFSFNLPRII